VDLERLCADAGLRSALVSGALRQGALDFDPLLIRRKFQSALREIAQEKTVSPRR
jgi:hypothetical protein